MKLLLVSMLFLRADRLRALGRALAARGHQVVFLTADAVDDETAQSEPFDIVTIPFVRGITRIRRTAGVTDEVNLADAAGQKSRLVSRLVRTAAHCYESLTTHPDRYSAWIAACRKWLRANRRLDDTDAVIAAAAPFTSQFVGRLFSERADAALVLDFQDLWVTGNPYYPFGPWRRALDRRAEAGLIEDADAVVTFSDRFTKELAAAYPGKRISTIYPGIDPEPWRVPPKPDANFLSFAHFGITYSGLRDIRPLLESLRRLADSGSIDLDRVRVDLWGEYDDGAKAATRDLGMTDVVRAHGFIPPDGVPVELAAADVALLLMWPEDLVNLPLKALHYLAAGKHIIVTGTTADSELSRRLRNLPGIDLCFDDATVDEAVMRLWQRWETGDDLSVGEDVRPYTFTIDRMRDEFERVLSMKGASL